MRSLLIAICLQVAFLASSTFAQPTEIGLTTPIGWQGTGTRYISINPFSIEDEDLNLGLPNSDSHLSIDDDEISVFAAANVFPWEMDGYIDTGSDLPPADLRRIGGFFRDEIYVASTSGDPLQIEFQVDLEALLGNLDTFAGESVAHLTLSMGYYPDGANSFANGTFRTLDFFGLQAIPVEQFGEEEPAYIYQIEQEDWEEGVQYFNSPPEEVEDEYYYSDVVALSTNGQDASLHVASGTWLPISIGLWGSSYNSHVNWSDTFTLNVVDVYDATTGDLLEFTEYAVVSPNDSFPSNGAIPEPNSLVLLTWGFTGILVFQRMWSD